MEAHPGVFLVLMSAHVTPEEVGRILERCGAAHRRRRSVLCGVTTAIAWSCDQMHTASALVVVVAAIPLSECLQTCVVAGSGCKVGLRHSPCCSLRFHRGLGWKAEAVGAVEGAGVQPVVWLTRESNSQRQLSHTVVEIWRDVLELQASQVSVAEDQLTTPAVNQDTGRKALRVVRAVDRCCPLGGSTASEQRVAPLADLEFAACRCIDRYPVAWLQYSYGRRALDL